MDRSIVEAWLDRYVEAWKSYDRAAIADLFSADAIYRFHPYDDGADVVHDEDRSCHSVFIVVGRVNGPILTREGARRPGWGAS